MFTWSRRAVEIKKEWPVYQEGENRGGGILKNGTFDIARACGGRIGAEV